MAAVNRLRHTRPEIIESDDVLDLTSYHPLRATMQQQDGRYVWVVANRSLGRAVSPLDFDHVDMASLSRRACYKCGNVGHYAEVCSSSERLCYNCKFDAPDAGTRLREKGGEARLTNGRTTGKQPGMHDAAMRGSRPGGTNSLWQAMSPTRARSLARRKESSATTVRGWATFKPTVRRCVSAVRAPAVSATPVASPAISRYASWAPHIPKH